MSETQNSNNPNINPLAEALSRPEIQASIANALENLTDFLEKYDAVNRMLTFANEVMKDKESLSQLLNGLKGEFPSVHLSRETLESALILLDKLPKISKYVQVMEQIFDTLESVATDKQSLGYLFNSAKEIVEPLSSKVQDGVSMIQEVQIRAESITRPVTLFSVLKLLKDPSVQRGFQLFSAFLEVVGERQVQVNAESRNQR
jgi:uncharacterized protein YjgD (DUF1641 family)